MNISHYIFSVLSSVRSPFGSRSVLRSVLDRFSFGSRSVLVRFSFGSRSVLVRFSIVLRSILVHPPFILRSGIEDRSKNDRKTKGESSEVRRRCIETLMGSQGKGNPNKKTPKIPHKPHAPDFQKKTLKKTFNAKNLENQYLTKNCQKFLQKNFSKHLVVIEKRRTFALANQK